VKSPPPAFAGRATFRAREEVLEWHVQEGAASFGEDLAVHPEVAVNVDAPAAALGHPRGDRKLAVDEHWPAIADEDPGGHSREAVPCSEEAACLVQSGADEAPVDDPGPGLVALAEGKRGLVAVDSLLRREGEVDAVQVLATAPTGRVVVRRNSAQRRPPRSKWAL
jgi:hypothetical protein